MKIALGQINPTIGDFEGNLALIEDALGQAERGGADLLVLSGAGAHRLSTARPAEAAGVHRRDRTRAGAIAEVGAQPPSSSGCGSGLRYRRQRPVQHGRAAATTGGCRAFTARRCCRPTTSSTRIATSSRPGVRDVQAAAPRRHDLRGSLERRRVWPRRLYREDPMAKRWPKARS